MKKIISIFAVVSLLTSFSLSTASADAAKPGQSMTHMKTVEGISAALESLGVVLYVQGGATAALMGDSLSSANGQVVFHIPVTATNNGVEHKGSNVLFFNTTNNKQLVIKNPVIDLKTGTVSALIGATATAASPLFTISNAASLKAAVTNDRKAKLRTTAYKGAALALAPGIAGALVQLLELPAGSLAEATAFATADVSIYGKIK
jgi:hypothetical protein